MGYGTYSDIMLYTNISDTYTILCTHVSDTYITYIVIPPLTCGSGCPRASPGGTAEAEAGHPHHNENNNNIIFICTYIYIYIYMYRKVEYTEVRSGKLRGK